MSKELDPRIKERLAEYFDNPMEAVWQHKQSKIWLAKHKALEQIAARAGITYDEPIVLQFDLEKKVAAFIVTGRLGNKTEWSVGEATAYNSQNQYFGSMAEKRGKDRVILKLIGLHGDIYSDEEMDENKPIEEMRPPKTSKAPKVVDNSPDGVANRLILKMNSFKTWPELKAWDALQNVKDARDKLGFDNIDLSNEVEEVFLKLKEELPINQESIALDDGRGGAFRND